MNKNQFIRYVQQECALKKVPVYIRDAASVDVEGSPCSGYFDPEGPKGAEIAVARRAPLFFKTIVHEFSHFIQWRDQTPAWVKADVVTDEIDRWLAGKNIPHINAMIDRVKYMELEAERIAVGLVKQLHLPINIGIYTKQANAYVAYHNWLKMTRKWLPPHRAAYINKTILAVCSDKFNMNHKKLNNKMLKAFRKAYPNDICL